MAAPDASMRRAFVVWAIANCIAPEAIPSKFQERFKGAPAITLDEIHAADPRRLNGEWRKYFEDERAAFYEAPNNKQFRMAMLSRVITTHLSRGGDAPAIAIKALELLAKEDSDFYTSKAGKADGKSDGPSTFTFTLDHAKQD